jgi:uncharacterized protein YggE
LQGFILSIPRHKNGKNIFNLIVKADHVKRRKGEKMKRDFLKELGIDEEAINKIMAENGKDINNAKADVEKISAENEQLKKDLETANATLDKVKDYDNVKADVEKYKADLEKSKSDYENKIAAMELAAKVKDFTGSKKFVNDLTRDAINKQLADAVNDDANKGKSLEELFNALTDGKENIFENENKPTPPNVPNMANDKPGATDDDAAVRRIMGLPPKK